MIKKPTNNNSFELHKKQLETLKHNGLKLSNPENMLINLEKRHYTRYANIIVILRENKIVATQNLVEAIYEIDVIIRKILFDALKSLEVQLTAMIIDYFEMKNISTYDLLTLNFIRNWYEEDISKHAKTKLNISKIKLKN